MKRSDLLKKEVERSALSHEEKREVLHDIDNLTAEEFEVRYSKQIGKPGE